MWTTLLPVLVGGAIALAGSCVGPWLLETRKEKSDLRTLRAEKFEELVKAVYELDHWLDRARDRALGGATGEPTVSPFGKVEAISAIYFPDFAPFVVDLEQCTNKYVSWIAHADFDRVSGKLLKLPIGLDEVLNSFVAARDKLIGELSSFARRNFHEADPKARASVDH
jgi:hypothetical protein